MHGIIFTLYSFHTAFPLELRNVDVMSPECVFMGASVFLPFTVSRLYRSFRVERHTSLRGGDKGLEISKWFFFVSLK